MRRVFAVATVKPQGEGRQLARVCAPHPVIIRHQGRATSVAKKVLPIHLEAREREVLRVIGKRDGISMAEVVRRQIRNLSIEMVPAPAPVLKHTGTDNAAR